MSAFSAKKEEVRSLKSEVAEARKGVDDDNADIAAKLLAAQSEAASLRETATRKDADVARAEAAAESERGCRRAPRRASSRSSGTNWRRWSGRGGGSTPSTRLRAPGRTTRSPSRFASRARSSTWSARSFRRSGCAGRLRGSESWANCRRRGRQPPRQPTTPRRRAPRLAPRPGTTPARVRVRRLQSSDSVAEAERVVDRVQPFGALSRSFPGSLPATN